MKAVIAEPSSCFGRINLDQPMSQIYMFSFNEQVKTVATLLSAACGATCLFYKLDASRILRQHDVTYFKTRKSDATGPMTDAEIAKKKL